MLTFCALLVFGLSVSRAQVAYNFTTTPDQITISGAPVALPMDCLAANGYGQWTSSSASSGVSNLLTNKLTSTGADNAQDGVLSTEGFAYSSDAYPSADAIKCAANLKGSVRYVWFGTTNRNQFYAEGFDAGAGGVDISFSGLPTTTSVISTPPSLGLHNPYLLTTGHTLVTSGNEANALDRFDIAIDASFLYVVWEENNSGVFSVWAEVIKLSDGSIAMGATTVATNALRPTVSVDIRNTGSLPGNFDVAFLDPAVGTTTGGVHWTEWNGTSFNPLQSVGSSFSDPLLPHPPNPAVNWVAPLHARILTASEFGVSPATTNQRAVYVIAGTEDCPSYSNPCKMHLFLDYIYNGGPPSATCEYCDGFYNGSRPSGCPVESGLGFELDDNPIWAFANPYEGQNIAGTSSAMDFTGFHCLYQLQRSNTQTSYGHMITETYTFTSTPSSNNPLMIIPGSNVGNGFCVNGNGSSAFFADPAAMGLDFDGYCGAVNQMGVHVHWTSSTTHFYRRDLHKFDQNIEENTLMTDVCEVANISSTVPEVLPNLTLTLYGDPTTNLFYTGFGNLCFDNSATLNIGSSTDAGADFVIAGAFQLNAVNSAFPTSPPISPTWNLAFGAGNTWDFYGNNPSNQALFGGTGSITMTGGSESTTSTSNTGGGDFVSAITSPVLVNLHPGTQIIIGPTSLTTTITATGAYFDFMSGTSIPHGTSGTASGTIVIDNNSSFTKCQLFSDATSGDLPIIFIGKNGQFNGTPSCSGSGDANYDGIYGSAANSTVSFTKCWFHAGTGASVGHALIFMSGDESPSALTIAEGRLSGWSVDGNPLNGSVSPWWPISITQAQFDTIQQFGIDIDESNPFSGITGCFSQLYSILINDNDFESYFTTNHLHPDGIIISGAPDATLNDALRQDITVTNNTFEHTSGATAGSVEAAIQFLNTTGDIGYNLVTSALTSASSEYAIGIWNHSVVVGSPPMTPTTWTFICDNTIAGTTTTALSTDNYFGYAKLNIFQFNEVGQLSGANDVGHIDASSYTNNISFGYNGSSNSKTDLSGVHHDPLLPELDDDAAFDTLTNNNTGGTQISLTGTSGATVFLGLEPGSPTWTVFGENDIEGSPNQICSASSISLGDVSNNYWGGSTFSFCTGTTGTGGFLTSKPSSSGWSCSSGLITKKKKDTPMSILNVESTPPPSCGTLFGLGYILAGEGSGAEPGGYDTLRMFLEDCPFYGDSTENNPNNSWGAFDFIRGAVTAWTTGGAGRWPDFFSYLKQVLYYNPDSNWYCNDVNDMLIAPNNNGELERICMYILQSGKCPGWTSTFQSALNEDIQNRHTLWLDSLGYAFMVKEDSLGMDGSSMWPDSIGADTLAHPFTDTVVPTLFQDSLQILLGPQYASSVGASTPITSQALLSAQLLENPMQDEIDVSYEMGRTALVTMELRDVLGRAVPIANAKYQLEQPGDHTATLPAPNLPQGTYYLRITTDVGDAITLKIVKQ